MVVSTLNCYPFGMAFSPDVQNRYKALPEPESGYSLLQLESKPLENDKNLLRLVQELQTFYLKDTMSIFKPVLTVEMSYESWLALQLFNHFREMLQALFQIPQLPPQSPRASQPQSEFDAVYSLLLAVVHNGSMAEWVNDRLKDHLKEKLNEGVLTRLRQLKETLLTFTVALDEVLQRYTVDFDSGPMTGEMLERIKSAKADMKTALKRFRPQDLHKLQPEGQEGKSISPDHILCSVLGVSEECADWLNNIPHEVRCHETDAYWIEQFLEDKADKVTENEEGAGVDANVVEQLVQLGFTRFRATYLADRLEHSAKDYQDHQTLLDWAKIYINDLFCYDILLTDVPRYPYHPEERGRWVSQDISADGRLWDQNDDSEDEYEDGDGEEEMEGARQEGRVANVSVPIINLEKQKDMSYTPRDDVKYPPESDDEHLVLFHGTDHKSAVSLVESGIIRRKGKNNQDFSGHKRNGFYLSPDFEWAKAWAGTRSASHAALVVYKVPKEHLVQFESASIDLDDDRETWTEIVRHCRTDGKVKLSKPTEKLYKKASYIRGPICITKPMECHQKFKPAGFERRIKQTCILSEDMAKVVGDVRYIDGVMFF